MINSTYAKSLLRLRVGQAKTGFCVSRVNKYSGFTIIELVVTITVTGLVVLAITGLFIGIEKTQYSALLLESATRAGEQEIESLRNNSYSTLLPGSTIDFASTLPSVLPAPRTAVVSVSQPTDGLRRLDVNITYTNRGQTKQVKLSSLIGQIGIGQ